MAECGGFLYLGQSLEDANGNAGPWQAFCRARASGWGGVRFGYATLTANADRCCSVPESVCPCTNSTTGIPPNNGTGFTAAKAQRKQWECGFANEHLYAGFPHFYWAGTALPRRFVSAATIIKTKEDQ